MSEKADYTNLERIQSYARYGNECPEVFAEYLHGFSFCPKGLECSELPHLDTCVKCIKKWLNERAKK